MKKFMIVAVIITIGFFVVFSAIGLVFRFYKTENKGTEEKICQDACGDGQCQEIVCLGNGCPCPETPETCPQDCSYSPKR